MPGTHYKKKITVWVSQPFKEPKFDHTHLWNTFITLCHVKKIIFTASKAFIWHYTATYSIIRTCQYLLSRQPTQPDWWHGCHEPVFHEKKKKINVTHQINIGHCHWWASVVNKVKISASSDIQLICWCIPTNKLGVRYSYLCDSVSRQTLGPSLVIVSGLCLNF